MYETGLPYTMDPHTLETTGADTFNGALTLKAFAAHFRLDMKQGVSKLDRRQNIHLGSLILELRNQGCSFV